MLKLRARAWLCHALCAPGQHTANRRRTCTRQSRSCWQLLPNNHRFKNRLRFHRITVMILWPQCLAQPVVIRSAAAGVRTRSINSTLFGGWQQRCGLSLSAVQQLVLSQVVDRFRCTLRSHQRLLTPQSTHIHTPIQRMFVHSEPTWHFRTIPRPAGYIAISFITPTRLVHSASAELNAMN